METLPLYVYLTFGLTVITAACLFYMAAGYSKSFLFLFIAWIGLQTILSVSGFYKIAGATPPRFPLLVVPPVVLVIFLFNTSSGRKFIDSLDMSVLTILHTVRIAVEVVLFWLFVHKAVPGLMTFEGRNFDILSGLSAPFVYYFGFVKKNLNKYILLIWNFVCLALLFNIAFYAILSAPTKFQQFSFQQPNIALGYFPFVLLPAFLVPMVLFCHLAAIRQLILKKTSFSPVLQAAYQFEILIFIPGFSPVSYCRFKYVNVYIFQRFKLDAIPGYARLAYVFSIRLG